MQRETAEKLCERINEYLNSGGLSNGPSQARDLLFDARDFIGAIARNTANARQVAGDHYRKHGEGGKEQHWDRVWRLYGHGYFVGNITKYVERYRDKYGLQDLHKARHYIDKLIELETERYAQVEANKEKQQ